MSRDHHHDHGADGHGHHHAAALISRRHFLRRSSQITLAAAITVGTIGLIVAAKPALWVSLFTSDPGVTAAAHSYFTWAGPAFAFFGIGACLLGQFDIVDFACRDA